MLFRPFKNLCLYRQSRDLSWDAESLPAQLAAFAFVTCTSQDMAKAGWVPPLENLSDSLIHTGSGHILLVVQREEKILPSPVLKMHLQEKIEKLQQSLGRKLKKAEKDSLKDEVLHTLLPRAFSKYSRTEIWIDTTTGLIAINATSAKRAEDALALLRKSIGSLPVVPLTFECAVELTLTEWLKTGNAPAGFLIQDEAQLTAILEHGGVIGCKRQDLISDEISVHLEAGKVVTKLALEWQERITFSLSDDGVLSKLKFCDTLLNQNDDIDLEDLAQRFDADFLLFTSEVAAMIAEVIAALGGEYKGQQPI
ncbi:MAG TPA: recombination-associated protein RdgC [Buttiauxella sp.]|jgi:recombination associated protein RdgC